MIDPFVADGIDVGAEEHNSDDQVGEREPVSTVSKKRIVGVCSVRPSLTLSRSTVADEWNLQSVATSLCEEMDRANRARI